MGSKIQSWLLIDDWCHQVHVHRGRSANEAPGGAGLSSTQDVSCASASLSTNKHCAHSIVTHLGTLMIETDSHSCK